MCTMYMPSVHGGHLKVSDALELKLHMIVNHLIVSVNQTSMV